MNGIDLMGMPNEIHVITRYQKSLRMLFLQVEVHFVSGDSICEELLVFVVIQRNLVEKGALPAILTIDY